MTPRTIARGAGLGVAAIGLALAAGSCNSTQSVSKPKDRSVATAATAPTVSTTPTVATTSTLPATTTTVATKPTLPATTTTTAPKRPNLSLGSSGVAVLAVQKRLVELHYWLGTPDGIFGDSTQQAVYAFQKAAGIERDGIVGPVTEAALAKGYEPVPATALPGSPSYLIEVDLKTDLVMFVDHGKLAYTLNTSTGGGYTYDDGSGTAIAETPVGVFHTYREVDGMVTDSLGQLWMPKFFTSGFAIHGDSFVPPYPASHGCVRVSNEAIEWIWSAGLDPIGTEVWVYD